jgi:hypothetical protein
MGTQKEDFLHFTNIILDVINHWTLESIFLYLLFVGGQLKFSFYYWESSLNRNKKYSSCNNCDLEDIPARNYFSIERTDFKIPFTVR